MCTAIPNPNPTAVHMPVFREYVNEFLMHIKKSGPGLITASKCTRVTVPMRVILSIENLTIQLVSWRPTRPTMVTAIKASRNCDVESPKRYIPNTAIATADAPVQNA